jgi:hypothetical protein
LLVDKVRLVLLALLELMERQVLQEPLAVKVVLEPREPLALTEPQVLLE